MKKDAVPNSSMDSLTNVGLILNPPGNFTSETSEPLHLTSNQHSEGDDEHFEEASDMVSHHENTVNKRVTFRDQGQDNEIPSDSPGPVVS